MMRFMEDVLFSDNIFPVPASRRSNLVCPCTILTILYLVRIDMTKVGNMENRREEKGEREGEEGDDGGHWKAVEALG